MRQLRSHPLWVGHAGDGRDHRATLAAGIEAVVQVAADEVPLQPPRSLIVCHFPLVDGPGNDPRVLRLAATTAAGLLRQRIPTLICCGAGLSRSPAIAAAALALATGAAPDACLRDAIADGPADVTPGLWAELVRAILDEQG